MTTSCIFIGVIANSNGGELTDTKERNRQRARERYAQMDKQKKDERNNKRREVSTKQSSNISKYKGVMENSISTLPYTKHTCYYMYI